MWLFLTHSLVFASICSTSPLQTWRTTKEIICWITLGQKVILLITILHIMNLVSITTLSYRGHAEYCWEKSHYSVCHARHLLWVVNNQHWLSVSQTSLSRSWHQGVLLTLNSFNDQHCIWFIMYCIWRNSTVIHLFFPLCSERMDQ